MNQLAIISKSIAQEFHNDTTWSQFLDLDVAWKGLLTHIGKQLSDDTPEQYTRESYTRGAQYFIKWAGGYEMRLPDVSLLNEFVVHLLKEKVWYQGSPPKDGSPDLRTVHHGVSASTVASSYLAPVRIFLQNLVNQPIPHKLQINPMDSEETKAFKRDMQLSFYGWKDQIRIAMDVGNPVGEKSNVGALWNFGNRLTKRKVKKVLDSFERDTIVSMRDYLIFRIGFETGLRVAELQRITLESLGKVSGVYTITVRGKRMNFDAVSISKSCRRSILDYVEMYNAPLDEDDDRRILDTNPIFQPMRKGGGHPELGNEMYNAEKGLSKGGIRNIIKRVSAIVFNNKIILSAHDLRRTFASLAFKKGMSIIDIQAGLRHASAAITMAYIGNPPNLKKTLITEYVDLD